MKKILSLILALLMFAVPALGSAATMTAVTFDTGVLGMLLPSLGLPQDLATGITDLINGLSITYIDDDDAFYAGLAYNTTDIITLAGENTGDLLVFDSNLLGGAISLRANDVEGTLTRVLESIGVDPQQIQQLMQTGTPSSPLDGISPEDWAKADPTPILNWVFGLAEKADVAAPHFQYDTFDTATQCITIDLTAEDLNGLLTAVLETMKSVPGLYEAFDTMLASTGASLNDLQVSDDMSLDLLFMTNDNGVVYANWKSGDQEGTYQCLTVDGVQRHNVEVFMSDSVLGINFYASETEVLCSLTICDYAGGVVTPNTGIDFVCKANGTTADWTVSLKQGADLQEMIAIIGSHTKTADGCNGSVFIDMTGLRLFGVQYRQAETTGLAHLNPAVNLSDLSNSELSRWISGVGNAAAGTLIGVVQALPESLLSAILSMVN